MTKDLPEIARWKMTEPEAKAYRVAYIWQTQVKKIFPDLQTYSKLPKSGDPRKSNLFRYCWKLVRETRGLLKDEEYEFYVIANLHILKVHQGHVEPNALCGDKAWYRWLVWKRQYAIKSQQLAGDRLIQEKQIDPRLFKELGLTKKFLFEKCEGEPTLEKLRGFFSTPKMRMWVGGSKVTPYYLILSPWVAKICDNSKFQDVFQLDPALYEQKLDEAAREHFKREYAYEF